jgi:periplasmic divalent cation tolerance protein
MELRSIYITAKDEAEARVIGRTLVEEKLIACANYFPINSVYSWKGVVEESVEVAIIAKTRTVLMESLIQRIKELHSYEVPCIVSWKIEEGNPDYLQWIKDSTEPD